MSRYKLPEQAGENTSPPDEARLAGSCWSSLLESMQAFKPLSAIGKQMSSETANKGLGIFGVVAFGFFILLAVGKCSSGSVAENPERIDQKGVVGTWFDEEGRPR
ncbi:hypothetical protein M5C90_24600 [Pseudomonas chlororaphis subsp. piscium]|nr:hypothetical protein M5C90_24600 [Pseudomonas chlororaphis subsp. piscium]